METTLSEELIFADFLGCRLSQVLDLLRWLKANSECQLHPIKNFFSTFYSEILKPNLNKMWWNEARFSFGNSRLCSMKCSSWGYCHNYREQIYEQQDTMHVVIMVKLLSCILILVYILTNVYMWMFWDDPCTSISMVIVILCTM